MVELADIQAARARLRGRIHETPTLSARRLAARCGAATLALKCETLQKTGSFKVRGAMNRIALLDGADRARGVITVSAGNHAQALAYAAHDAGVPCTVVMPVTAPRTKVAASREYGAEVELQGASSIEAFAYARKLANERGLFFLHPFDDEGVIAGQGTVGLEILDAAPAVTDVIVPIGGGGLIAGIAIAIRSVRPDVRIFGVEPDGAAVMRRSLDAGKPVALDRVQTMADGLAAPMAGVHTFAVVREHVDDVVLVSDGEIAAAMRELLFSAKILAEGAGAAGLAALLTGRLPVAGRHVVCVVSGGNVDPAVVADAIRV